MREIKFRIWDKKYLTFDYNASPELFISTEGEVFEKDRVNFAMQSYDEYNKVDNYEISQYTGLKDKNGKDIYEGDIITGNSYGDDYPLIIKWDYEYSGFYCHDPKGDDEDHLNMQEAVNGTVIGNIYENPELVKL